MTITRSEIVKQLKNNKKLMSCFFFARAPNRCTEEGSTDTKGCGVGVVGARR